MDGADRIDLAHSPGFTLGRLAVRPPTRELVRDDGAREVLEPRVMQVLVALARADGSILTREDLTRQCWEGRVVGEDAINRVISRLRRSADAIGQGSFAIETVTKVGYRLVPAAPGRAPWRDATAAGGLRPSRRLAIGAGIGLVALAGAGTAALLLAGRKQDAPSPEVAALMSEGMAALHQVSSESNAQAIGFFRRATELAPDYADGWGALALGYAVASHYRDPRTLTETVARARAAARHALALDPGNGLAEGALASLLPRSGQWAEADRLLLHALRREPGSVMLVNARANLLLSVGRFSEAARLLDAHGRTEQPLPWLLYTYALALWGANRLEETDLVLARGRTLYPLHFALWFARVYYLMHGGRAREAIAIVEDREGRPRGIPDDEFDRILATARAMVSGDPAARAAVLRVFLDFAHKGTGYAENAIQFASTLGDLDMAFTIADAYFFSRGFTVPELRFAGGQGTFTRLADRRSFILFLPPTAAMRADPRFERLVSGIGLARYWAESKSPPDYRSARPQ